MLIIGYLLVIHWIRWNYDPIILIYLCFRGPLRRSIHLWRAKPLHSFSDFDCLLYSSLRRYVRTDCSGRPSTRWWCPWNPDVSLVLMLRRCCHHIINDHTTKILIKWLCKARSLSSNKRHSWRSWRASPGYLKYNYSVTK